jgi:tRNA 2-selenouridine synthase
MPYSYICFMAFQSISAEEALKGMPSIPLLDVRSPGEYQHAHIPGAHSFPVFTDEERALIGTAYKREGREKAIRLGLSSFGAKMVQLTEEAEKIAALNQSRDLVVHCWRGGMRSTSIAWLLDFYGFRVRVISGGYKSFRNFALGLFGMQRDLITLGGYTGSNKTAILTELEKQGEKAIDLEKIASHRGSAFGHLGMPAQPTQEQFENRLAIELYEADRKPGPIWVESESQRIGNVNIPSAFFQSMRQQPLVFLNIPFQERLDCIIEGYGSFDRDQLLKAIERIKKRLGGLDEKIARSMILEGETRRAFAVLLRYYDKYYHKSTFPKNEVSNERTVQYVDADNTDPVANALKVSECLHQISR